MPKHKGQRRREARDVKYSSGGTDVNDFGESMVVAADIEPIEGVLYRVTYIERALGLEKTMTARYGGRSLINRRWLPVWELDPPDQNLHGVGLIGQVLSAEVVDAGGSEP